MFRARKLERDLLFPSKNAIFIKRLRASSTSLLFMYVGLLTSITCVLSIYRIIEYICTYHNLSGRISWNNLDFHSFEFYRY